MIKERPGWAGPAYPILFALIAVTVVLAAGFVWAIATVINAAETDPEAIAAPIVLIVVFVAGIVIVSLGYVGLTVVNPNEARALVALRQLHGTVKRDRASGG